MSKPIYFDLSIPAPRRLAMMRAAFAKPADKYPHCPESAKPGSWRGIRGFGLHTWQRAFATLSSGFNDKNPVWYTHAGPEFRDERNAEDIVRSLPRGWYTDADASECARGIVSRLPHGRFIAGYVWESNDERVYYPDVFDDEKDAAYAADSHAERFAESAREDSERFNAMQDAETAAEDAAGEVRAAWNVYKAARVAWVTDSARFWPALDKARARVSEAIENLRTAREELETAAAEYEGA